MLELTYYSILLFFFISGPFIASYYSLKVSRDFTDIKINSDRRSQCDNCSHALSWQELIPLLSYVILRGRCKSCKKKINPINFYSELIGLIAFSPFIYILISTVLSDTYSPVQIFSSIFLAMFIALLLYLAIFDMYTYSIPSQLTNGALLLLLVFSIILNIFNILLGQSIIDLGIANIDGIFMSVVLSFATYCLIILTKQRGMGEGDVWIVGMIGLVLGWPESLMAIYFSIVIGGIVGILLILTGRNIKGMILPFVPFLLIGTSLSVIIGERIFIGIFS